MPSGSEGVNVLEQKQTKHFVTFEPTICTYKQTSSILQTDYLQLNTAHYLPCLGGCTT
jgi:hypothetical protein